MAPVPMTAWQQFGLEGVVIGALFATLLFFIRQHYTERSEWRSDLKDIAAKHDDTTKEVASRFSDLHKETLETLKEKNRHA